MAQDSANQEGPFKLAEDYYLSAALGYHGCPYDFSHSRFNGFEQHPIYLFPIYDHAVPFANEIVVVVNKVVETHTIDIEAVITALEEESSSDVPRYTASFQSSENYEVRLLPVDSDSNLLPDEVLFSSHQEHSQSSDENSVNESSVLAEGSCRTLALESGEFSERVSTVADNATIVSEGSVQPLPHLLEGGLSPKNPLLPQMRINLVRVPEKLLSSVVLSEATETAAYLDAFYSPLTVKLALCEADGALLSLINAVTTRGFLISPYLEYSDDGGSACLDLRPSQCHLRLLAQSVLTCIGTTEVLSVSFGFQHAALLTGAGKVMTWGFGGFGCLGLRDTQSQATPVAVWDLLKETAVYVECGGYHTVCVTDTGDLFTWGRGDVHQTGLAFKNLATDNIGYYSAKPIKLTYFPKHSIKVQSAACGEAHTLVLDSEGRVYSFGWGESGQLGIDRQVLNSAMATSQIQRVDVLATVQKVAAGRSFSACLTREGRVLVWGSGELGQLGNGQELRDSDFPLEVDSLPPILDLCCGESSVMCVDCEQTFWGWGLGSSLNIAEVPGASPVIRDVPQQLCQVDSVLHLKIDKTMVVSSILPSPDYQERVSELAEQLRLLYSEP